MAKAYGKTTKRGVYRAVWRKPAPKKWIGTKAAAVVSTRRRSGWVT